MIAPSLVTFSLESELIFNLQDIHRFSGEVYKNPRMFHYIVLATFGAAQAGMIMTRGEGWLKVKHSELAPGKRPHAKEFRRLYDELQDRQNWDGSDGQGLSWSIEWDRGIDAVKSMRDQLIHPQWHRTHLSALSIQKDCLRVLEYLKFLIDRSLGIHIRFGARLPEVVALHQSVISKLSGLIIDQVTPLNIVDIPPLPAAIEASFLASLEKSAAANGAVPLFFKNGLPHKYAIVPELR